MGLDYQTWLQISSILGNVGSLGAYSNPRDAQLQERLDKQNRAALQAEAQKQAKKEAEDGNSGIGSLIGTAASVAAAPFTGGTSLMYAPAAASIGSGVESAIGGDFGAAAQQIAGGGAEAYGMYKGGQPVGQGGLGPMAEGEDLALSGPTLGEIYTSQIQPPEIPARKSGLTAVATSPIPRLRMNYPHGRVYR